MTTQPDLPNLLLCPDCHRIVAIDLLNEGWNPDDLAAKIAAHRRRDHDDD